LNRLPKPAYNRAMTLLEFDRWVRSILAIDETHGRDRSLNGIQIGPDHRVIKKIAFAVDASLAGFQRAAREGADLLFVHHGLFWGVPLALRGSHYERIHFAMEKELSLYAVHLPLDMHDELGNNAGMAALLGLENLEPFGDYNGLKIGWKGTLPQASSPMDIMKGLWGNTQDMSLLDFGPEKVTSIGIVSGGASREVEQAVDEKLDLYITGEPSHQTYHYCLEQGINVIAAGHYATETFGVKLMAQRVKQELGIDSIFIDLPTGL
jgi:dinuclear metal center YbgI/SA1388 family protein